MPITWVKERVRKIAMRRVMRGQDSALPDITTLRKVPDHLTYPLRRNGLDLLPEVADVRTQEPVTLLGSVLGLDLFLVTGYHESRAVLADRSSYSNDMRHLLGTRQRSDAEGIGGLGMTDPPDHTRLRGLLTPEFTMRRLKRLEGLIDGIVEDALDGMEAAGPVVDLVQRFGFEIPFRVICDLLGMPEEVRDEFHGLGVARFDVSQGGVGVFGAATDSRTFLIETVKQQRSDPGEGLIGEIIRNKGHEYDDVELGGLADGVFLGGYETSASMLSMGAYVLMQRPDAYELLRSGTRAEVDGVIEELLRYLCPVQIAFPRFAKEDHDLYGKQVKKGSVVVVSLAAANRDPAHVPTPDQFSLENAETAHLAFGHGLHRCVGAELARMEMRAALTGLARRFPDLAMATEDVGELGFRDLSIVYSLDKLPVRLNADPALAAESA
ncbi:cytochrome P450 [Nocardioides insulae]|uniref:cytochrome P450 n=1 Tax=Nocardioides insulae TaxID=394734 RepID=UPI001FE06F78|nr:cytochrome P450 [Nocardioides insulae]